MAMSRSISRMSLLMDPVSICHRGLSSREKLISLLRSLLRRNFNLKCNIMILINSDLLEVVNMIMMEGADLTCDTVVVMIRELTDSPSTYRNSNNLSMQV